VRYAHGVLVFGAAWSWPGPERFEEFYVMSSNAQAVLPQEVKAYVKWTVWHLSS
jgi:hypothetical protein